MTWKLHGLVAATLSLLDIADLIRHQALSAHRTQDNPS